MVDHVALLNEKSESLTSEDLTVKIGRRDVRATGFFDHTKATERYVILVIGDGASSREWYLPYYYRRTNVRIDTVAELVDYVKSRVPLLSSEHISAYKDALKKQLLSLFGKKANVTLPIFRELLENCGEWVWNKRFTSSNPQRRIQDIKEMGFTLATKMEDKKTFHMLLPVERVTAPTYETISSRTRKAIFKALGGIDAYTGRPTTLSALPDHKFPEVRWLAGVEEANEGLSEAMMRAKFQLVSERVNQEKREVCRRCFQSGIRGKFNGIDFFYHGDEKWPVGIPKTGAAAKVGCHGCFWFDMAAWRTALNRLIRERK